MNRQYYSCASVLFDQALEAVPSKGYKLMTASVYLQGLLMADRSSTHEQIQLVPALTAASYIIQGNNAT